MGWGGCGRGASFIKIHNHKAVMTWFCQSKFILFGVSSPHSYTHRHARRMVKIPGWWQKQEFFLMEPIFNIGLQESLQIKFQEIPTKCTIKQDTMCENL